ncbi:MAG: hypothetical protein P8185_22170, partial [Deltaproteobacteria bacterium]
MGKDILNQAYILLERFYLPARAQLFFTTFYNPFLYLRSHFKTSLELILRSFVQKRLARVFSEAQNLELFDSTGAL